MSSGEFEALQLLGNEFIQFVFQSPGEEGESDGEVYTSPNFAIIDFNDSSNPSDLAPSQSGSTLRTLTLYFTSLQEKSLFESENPFSIEGFIGKISVNSTGAILEDETVSSFFDDDFPDDDDDFPDPEEGPDLSLCQNIPGLINVLADKYFTNEEFEIEGTSNSVMVSPHRFSFPTRKVTKNMNLLQLINYCTRNAWKVNSGNSSTFGSANYFFWQDLFGWHFKSADKMVQDSSEVKEFELTSNVLNQKRIRTIDVISDFSEAKAWSTGMLYAYHTRVEPNYGDVYSRFLDDDQKYVETSYEYNYAKHYFPLVEPQRFLPNQYKDQPLEEWIRDKANDSLIVKDSLYGWYDNRQHNDYWDVYRKIGRGIDKGAPGPLGNTGSQALQATDPISVKEFSDYTRYQDNMWQEMFDCVKVSTGDDYNEDVCALRRIAKIKADTFNAKQRYKRALNYKEKWNLYKYSVCCIEEDEVSVTNPPPFFAIIKDHEKYSGASNIWKYKWARVALIPKEELRFIMGHRPDFSDYNLPNINDTLLINATEDLTTFQFFPLTSQNTTDIFKLGQLSGSVFFTADGVTAPAAITGSVSWDYVKDLFALVDPISGETYDEPRGVTLTFHNSQYSPFLVVEREEYLDQRGTSAINLNEVLNRPVLDLNTYPDVRGSCGDIENVYWQRSPFDDGDSSANPFEGAGMDNVQYLVGPGINASHGDDMTEYPDAFDTMPIGSYKEVNRNSDGEYLGPLLCEAIPVGHVVQMNAMVQGTYGYPSSIVEKFYRHGIDADSSDYTNAHSRILYYFSVANAHDGNCTGSCTL